MSNLCIIPARGGSKRIPNKNIKPFIGKCILAYSIEAAIECDLFDEVMVSTDNDEIGGIAKSFGANIPFLRSESNSNDFSGIADVLLEVIQMYKSNGKAFETICCILPTAPFVNSGKLKTAYKMIEEKNYDCVFSVTEYSYPIQRSLKNENGYYIMNWPENLNKRSQDLTLNYHDAGQFYFIKTSSLIKKKTLFTDKTGCLVLSNLEVQDIDTVEDWKLAELKYKLLKGL